MFRKLVFNSIALSTLIASSSIGAMGCRYGMKSQKPLYWLSQQPEQEHLISKTRWLKDTSKLFERYVLSEAEIPYLGYSKTDSMPASLVQGAAFFESGYGLRMYKKEGTAYSVFLKGLFHEIGDGVLRVTGQPGNPFYCVPAQVLGQLNRAIADGNVQTYLEDDLGLWRGHYNETLKKKKNLSWFRAEVRKRLQPVLDGKISKEDAMRALAGLAYAKSDQDEQGIKKYFIDYCNAFNGLHVSHLQPLSLQAIQHQGDTLEHAVSYFLYNIHPLAFTVPTIKNSSAKSCCVSSSVWSLVNLCLYDPETKILNATLFAREVHPELKDWVKKYPSVTAWRSREVQLEWLNLTSERDGILYAQTCYPAEPEEEILNTEAGILSVLNYLFRTEFQTLEALSEHVSVPGKKIIISKENVSEGLQINIQLCLKDRPVYKYRILAVRKGAHADFKQVPLGNSQKEIASYWELCKESTIKGAVLFNEQDYLHYFLDQLWNDELFPYMEHVEYYLDNGGDIDLIFGPPHFRVTLLQLAVKKQKYDLALFLLKKGAKHTHPDIAGSSLSCAVHNSYNPKTQKYDSVDYKMLDLLLDGDRHGNALNIDYHRENDEPLLIHALSHRNTELVRFCMERGASKNVTGMRGETALELAEKYWKEIVPVLNGTSV